MNTPFRTRQDKQVVGVNLATLLNRKPVKGQVGIEIEVEGVNLPKDPLNLSPFWVYHTDHSLRGEDNAEYVLFKPIDFDKVPAALSHLWGLFAKHESKLDESNRTSVHIHLNVQEFHLNRLASFLAIYFALEEVLTEWCGEHRVGNLFCLRAKDAPAIVTYIKNFIKSDGKAELRDCLHYAGLNAHALQKFGSIEIRTLRGVSDPDTILQWVGFLQRIYDLSAEFKDPRAVCDMFSADGPMTFFETVLGDKAFTLRQGINYTNDQVRDAMYDGIRLAQDICYCRDWDLYKPVDLRDDPFGRDKKKVAKSISGFQNMGAFNESYQSILDTLSASTASMAQLAHPAPVWNTFSTQPEPFPGEYIMNEGEPMDEEDEGSYAEEDDYEEMEEEPEYV